MIVKFASRCDKPGCGIRSEEYVEFPHCSSCGEHACPNHRVAGSVDDRNRCLCTDCDTWAKAQEQPEEALSC
jgi:hypothetical protein